MTLELVPVTKPGERFVALAETHAADFVTRAEQHDRENTFVTENFEAMKESGFLGACAPEEYGGLGLESVHDISVGISRVGRGCASTAIAANMHIGSVWTVTRWRRRAISQGDDATVARMEGFLPLLGSSTIVLSGSGTEPGVVGLFPYTEATPTEGGWLINGRKVFATNSEIADSISVITRVRDDKGQWCQGLAIVLRGTDGMEVQNDWDALGMRGSGSHGIVFSDCFVPDAMFTVNEPLGVPSPSVLPVLVGLNFPLVGAFLGVAEAARDEAVRLANSTVKKPFTEPVATGAGIQHAMGEIEVALAAARAALGRTGLAVDTVVAGDDDDLTVADFDEIMSDWQCTKLIVNKAAADIIDRALTISGGAGYMSASLLSRLYRDARAGPFMQPLAPYDAYEFIGRAGLGLETTPELREAMAGLEG